MNSAFVHAAVFGVGAAVGAGVASTVLERRRTNAVVSTPPPPLGPETAKIGATITHATRELQVTGNVLKYGHPGKWTFAASARSLR
jgi:hypothetical protein